MVNEGCESLDAAFEDGYASGGFDELSVVRHLLLNSTGRTEAYEATLKWVNKRLKELT